MGLADDLEKILPCGPSHLAYQCLKKMVLVDDEHLYSGRLFNTTVSRKLRHRKKTKARWCGICDNPMLLGKDVAALLNTKRLVCSSRNATGATPFCPDCRGTGAVNDDGELEKPTFISFEEKLQVGNGYSAWMEKSEKDLPNCSTGLCLSDEQDQSKGTITPMSLYYLYRTKQQS